MKRTAKNSPAHRTGVATLVTLLVLLVVLIGIGGIARWIAAGHNLDRIHRHQLQANCLAESGINRAKQLLAVDSTFNGDTWQQSEPLLRRGQVVTTVAREGNTNSIEAIAFYPADAATPRRAVRRWKQPISSDGSKD